MWPPGNPVRFNTPIDDIVAGVGVGKSALYHHYASRDQLFAASCDAASRQLSERCLKVSGDHEPDPRAMIRAVLSDLQSLNDAGAAIAPEALWRLRCGIRWSGGSSTSGGVAHGWFTGVVVAWQASEVLDPSLDPEWIAATVVALVSLPVATSGDQPPHGRTSLDRLVELIRRAFGGSWAAEGKST